MKFIVFIFTLASRTLAIVPILDATNYTSMTVFKTVFIKFFSPHCNQCKQIAPHWEKLADEWSDSEFGLVAEVDCTSLFGQSLCMDNGVKMFPTLKYGDPLALKRYTGKRKFENMSTFANENLKPICAPATLDLCDDYSKDLIVEFIALSDDKLEGLISDVEREMYVAEDAFHYGKRKIETRKEELRAEKDTILTEIESNGLSLMKIVKSSRA